MLLVGIILLWRTNILLAYASLDQIYYSPFCFETFDVLNVVLIVWVHSLMSEYTIFKWMTTYSHISASSSWLTSSIISKWQSTDTFSSLLLQMFLLCWTWKLSQFTFLGIRIDTPWSQYHILRILANMLIQFSSFLLSTSYLTTLKVLCPVLLQILIMISSYVCFNLMWLVR